MSLNVSDVSSRALQTPAVAVRTQSAKPEKPQQEVEQEKVSLGGQEEDPLTYSKPRAMPQSLSTLLDESNSKVEEFMAMLRPLLEQQGLSAAKVISGEQQLTVDQETIDTAKAAIAEDGEWGVRKVSERILSFAKFAMGDDLANLQTIRDAVESGFAQAKEALGGALPEISQKTYDSIMAEFDRWEKEGIPTGETVSLSKTADDKMQQT